MGVKHRATPTRYRDMLQEFSFNTGLPIIRRFQCARCLIPIAEVRVSGTKTLRVNIDGSKHWKSCKSR